MFINTGNLRNTESGRYREDKGSPGRSISLLHRRVVWTRLGKHFVFAPSYFGWHMPVCVSIYVCARYLSICARCLSIYLSFLSSSSSHLLHLPPGQIHDTLALGDQSDTRFVSYRMDSDTSPPSLSDHHPTHVASFDTTEFSCCGHLMSLLLIPEDHMVLFLQS
jgi:hypothetical protein